MYKFLQNFVQEITKALNVIKPFVNCLIIYLLSFFVCVGFESSGVSFAISVFLMILATVMLAIKIKLFD